MRVADEISPSAQFAAFHVLFAEFQWFLQLLSDRPGSFAISTHLCPSRAWAPAPSLQKPGTVRVFGAGTVVAAAQVWALCAYPAGCRPAPPAPVGYTLNGPWSALVPLTTSRVSFSSSSHEPLRSRGPRWFTHLSRHCFPFRSGIRLAISTHTLFLPSRRRDCHSAASPRQPPL